MIIVYVVLNQVVPTLTKFSSDPELKDKHAGRENPSMKWCCIKRSQSVIREFKI